MASFDDEARRFCAFVEVASAIPMGQRVREARRRLAALVARAAALPLEEAPDGADVPPVPAPTMPDLGAQYYWDVPADFATSPPVPSLGDLSDDILDIYLDMRTGLAEHEVNGRIAAGWWWRWSFDAHWGQHAVDALRVVHELCSRFPEHAR